MKQSITIVCLAVLSVYLLFFGYYKNQWGVVDKDFFSRASVVNQTDIVGRITETRKKGIFSYGGLLKGGVWDGNHSVPTLDGYIPYESQIGGQGFLYCILDRHMDGPDDYKIRMLHWLVAMANAVVMTFVIFFFYFQFGSWVALVVLVSTVFSPWAVAFGGNLYWCLGMFYVPMIVLMYTLDQVKGDTKKGRLRFLTLVFLSVFLKCLMTGYEYITTTLVMMMVPIVYYNVLDGSGVRSAVKQMTMAILGAGLAVLGTFLIISYQMYSFTGNYFTGIKHIIYSFAKRTYWSGGLINIPDVYIASLRSNPLVVVMTYLKGPFNLSFIKVSYWHLILIFALVSIGSLLMLRQLKVNVADNRKTIALIAATWFSIVAPLSWFVIFKGHSYIHTNLCYLAWHMPFTIFGFALCGVFIKDLAIRLMNAGRTAR